MARLIDSISGHRKTWAQLEKQASSGQLPHAMAFTGPSGVGKKKVAWALAQRLLCERENRPCGECGPCLRVASEQSESVMFLAPVNGVIKMESSRQILEFLSLRNLSRARVIVIDEAQSLNPQAANVLLKAVEEPPPSTYFIFVLAEISQLLPTLRSRVQTLRFAPLEEAVLRASAESAEPWALKSARGSLERLERYAQEDLKALRHRAFEFLQDGLSGERGRLENHMDLSKERDNLEIVIHFMQELLRDWTLPENHRLHRDLSAQLEKWPAAAEWNRAELWRKAFQMEADLSGHIDRALVLQNFFYRLGAPLS